LPHLIESVAFVDFEGSPYLVMTHLTNGLIRMSAEAAYQQAPCTSGDVPSYEVIARSAKGSQDLALAAGRVWFAPSATAARHGHSQSRGRHVHALIAAQDDTAPPLRQCQQRRRDIDSQRIVGRAGSRLSMDRLPL